MRVLVFLSGMFVASQALAALTLTANRTQFFIDPDTLSVQAQLETGEKLTLAAELNKITARNLKQNANAIQWQRDNTQVEALINGTSLVVRFRQDIPGDINWPQIPSAAKALILPLFEGSYIPTSDVQWRKALTEHYQDIDTTQDLSLPAIGFDYGAQVVSVIYANPFNNSLNFKPDAQGIAVSSKHTFTRLDQARPFEIRISIDQQDLLASAKHYRDWLQTQHQFVSLKNKLATTEDGKKLIGASHIYIWGERIITPQDVKDWPTLQKLIPTQWLTAEDIQQAAKTENIGQQKYLQNLLVQHINQQLEQEIPGYTFDIFQKRREKTITLFGAALTPTETWGDLTPQLINQMKQTGFKKLWLGLPQWTAGFANPAAIKATQAQGYLIGPYDSYDTALPDNNQNPSWLSAQLGQEAFLTCGILLENGKRKTGFNNEGVYTNPLCVKSLLEKRVQQLQNTLQFNSWFIDVDATGMLFDDYDPKRMTSQAQDAKNRIDNMAWIAKKLGIVVGSEDGNALVNSSIAFAHGMQVRGFGWRDQDMRKNESSPFYLGKWFPSQQPELFFKTVSIKPEYQALYFNPARRLPLFQAAFHDSLITTNHWSLDNLKFKETRQASELLQQLYNVPPLLNISLDTAHARLEYLKHIDNFFNPMHSRLYDKALIDFKYLTENGMLQQTSFSDGTKMIANFTEQAVQWEGKNISANGLIAILPNGEILSFNTAVEKLKH